MATMVVKLLLMMIFVCQFLANPAEGEILSYGALMPDIIPRQTSPPQPANNYTSGPRRVSPPPPSGDVLASTISNEM